MEVSIPLKTASTLEDIPLFGTVSFTESQCVGFCEMQ